MRDDPDVPHFGFVEGGRVDVRRQLHPRASPLVARVHPDFQDAAAARGLGPHHRARLGGGGYRVQPHQPASFVNRGFGPPPGVPTPGDTR